MNELACSLRVVLLRRKIKPDKWLKYLASFFNGNEAEAELLLSGQDETDDFRGRGNLERDLNENISILSLVDLSKRLDRDETLKLNLTYLFGTLPHGKKKHLASFIGIDVTTISKWLKGRQAPNQKNLKKILDYFALPEDIDLWSDQLFLSLIPIGDFETRKWIHQRIDNLDSNTLRQLMPALKKLFE